MIFINRQFVKIVVIGLLPCLNALFWLGFVSDGWLAMYSMHFICMFFIPTFCYGLQYLTSNLSDAIEYGKTFDILKCICVCLFTSFFGTSCLFLLLKISKIIPTFDFFNIEEIKVGLIREGIIKYPTNRIGFFVWFSSVYFSIVNPIIEELFWRSFVYKELIISLVRNEISLQSSFNINDFGVHYSDSLIERDRNSYLFESCQDIESGQTSYKSNTGFVSIICSVLYSIYHFFVLIYFSSIQFSILSTVSLAIIGWILIHVSRKLHITYSIYIHIGMDISIVIFLLLSLK
ncbi:CAAX protease self-immunity [Cryptosporidium sp. chipmunk genotype I]|uniref:CAAX protease self-immunity n=1 Tax=Cryptosporidium sp. chipmunk genotype I TaxID=1280935 RepID=UPI00351A7DC4|nr:CAAX protease self-immunity [Cryptosporidium sp. chipmunk genotype I]